MVEMHGAQRKPLRKKELALSADELRSFVNYDRETGEFTYLVRRGTQRAGARAGGTDAEGYRVLQIKRFRYLAHRLAWLYVTGEWPRHEIDHLNRCRSDNRFSNLRDVVQRVNAANHGRERALPVGVYRRGKRFMAAIRQSGRQVHLGYADTAEQAAALYHAAAFSPKEAL